jgi:hypothetical protein
MVDVDRWQFRFDIASVPISGVFLYVVLLGVSVTQSTSLEAGAYGVAILMCAATIVASLVLVRQRLTDWEAPAGDLQMLRSLLPLGWLLLQGVVGLPTREPLGQLTALPLAVCAFAEIVLLLLLSYSCLTSPADDGLTSDDVW